VRVRVIGIEEECMVDRFFYRRICGSI
jgi:hypothetical protein